MIYKDYVIIFVVISRKIMKEKHLKYFTAVTLMIIGLLQMTWVFYIYSLQNKDVIAKANEFFFEAAERELYPRVNEIPPNDTIEVAYEYAANQRLQDFITFQDLCSNKYGLDISLFELDSIFNELLRENNILVASSTSLVQTDSLYLFSSQKNRITGTVKTDLLPIRKDGSLHIQATLSNPYQTIITRIALLLVATILMMCFIAYFIILQIRIIVRQNRIAQLRQDFSYAMIHDMKTPLTSIMVGAQVLESGKVENNLEKKGTYFKVIKDEVQHLLALTNKVLTIAKLESQDIILEKQAVAIKPMIEDLTEKFSIRKFKNIEFITYISTEFVYADAEYLKEAISNLIDNAIKYSRQEVEIVITCETINSYDRISVKDNGLGISLRNQALIFEKFERGDATQRSSKGGATGFGLGLNYVQQVVKAHEGSVGIESIVGEYSEFTIILPKLVEELEHDKIIISGG